MPKEETSNYSQGKAVGNALTQQPRSGGILVYWSGSPKLGCPAGSSGVSSGLRAPGPDSAGKTAPHSGLPLCPEHWCTFPPLPPTAWVTWTREPHFTDATVRPSGYQLARGPQLATRGHGLLYHLPSEASALAGPIFPGSCPLPDWATASFPPPGFSSHPTVKLISLRRPFISYPSAPVAPSLARPRDWCHLCARLPHGPGNQSWKGPYIM